REKPDRLILDLDLECVELLVPREHRFGHRAVSAEQRVDGEIKERGREVRHVEQALLEVRKLVVKMSESDGRDSFRWGHPNLPVMYASVRALDGFVNMRSVDPSSTSWPR